MYSSYSLSFFCLSFVRWTNVAYFGECAVAGRDGKDFLKALSPSVLSKVVCLVDVDRRKIESIKWYDNPSLLGKGNRIPIMHFSALARDNDDVGGGIGDGKFGRIDKRKCIEDDFAVASSRQRTPSNDDCRDHERASPTGTTEERNRDGVREPIVDPNILRRLPVVVCVAMFRTNGALEDNVASIGRVEGVDLWHMI
jgi:hypothetical protein